MPTGLKQRALAESILHPHPSRVFVQRAEHEQTTIRSMASEEMAFTIPTIVARRAFPTVSEPTAREPGLAAHCGCHRSEQFWAEIACRS
jgi:hypothetical protein